MRSCHRFLLSFIPVLALSTTARADEICGNAQDDDDDGLADEGCFSPLVSAQCESPLSCGETGLVAPKTGSLHYSLPPDITPAVPWGSNIGFRRIYTSMYAPSPTAPLYRRPMGERWQHTYMTWIDRYAQTNAVPPDCDTSQTPPVCSLPPETPTHVVLHTSRGNDVRAAYWYTSAGWEYYQPQVGFHVQYIRYSPGSFIFEVKQLTGEVLTYGADGKLTSVADTLAIPNIVTIDYDANGQIATVTDASTTRRLLFSYNTTLLLPDRISDSR